MDGRLEVRGGRRAVGRLRRLSAGRSSRLLDAACEQRLAKRLRSLGRAAERPRGSASHA
jgi:hypothetical protein